MEKVFGIIIDFFTTIQNNFTVSDFLVVTTAIISAAISIWSIKKSTKFEQEWNQKQLDADLKSKARIEWIQKVRENTAELISLYYAMLKETNKDSLFEQLREAKKMNDLLILYFGPENNEMVDDFSVLECTETNNGKNDVLVQYLSSLFVEFNEYYKNTSRDVLSIIKSHRKDLWDDMINKPIDKIPIAPYITPDGEEIEQYEPVWDEGLQQKVKECDMQINSYYKQISVLENKLEELRNYMRIYLKLEWNKAKEGK